MDKTENLRNYILQHNPVKGSKTFSLVGIEEKLNIPKGLLDHFRAGRRGLGDHEEKVISFFKSIWFNENQDYGQFL